MDNIFVFLFSCLVGKPERKLSPISNHTCERSLGSWISKKGKASFSRYVAKLINIFHCIKSTFFFSLFMYNSWMEYNWAALFYKSCSLKPGSALKSSSMVLIKHKKYCWPVNTSSIILNQMQNPMCIICKSRGCIYSPIHLVPVCTHS